MSRRGVLAAAGLALAGCAGRAGVSGNGPVGDGLADGGTTIEIDGAPLHLVRRGRGRPIVLIHGASGNLRDWPEPALEAFAARGEVVAFDRPGHGLSAWPGREAVGLGDQARRMRAALDTLGIGRTTLVGHSYGGSVALAWALQAPETVDGLLLIAAPSHVWKGGLGVTTDLLANPLTGPVIARAAPALLPRSVAEAAAERVFAPQTPPAGYLDRVRLDLVLRPATLRANARQLAALKDGVAAMAPRYPDLATPIEILHGTADETVPIAIHSVPLAAEAPRARLTPLEGIGHMPHHVALAETLEAFDRLPG